MRHGPIVAVGLLIQREVNLLGPTFDRLWPVQQAPRFNELLEAIDQADRKISRQTMRSPDLG